MDVTSDSWAQLVSTTENNSEPILITKDKFSIGRSQLADLCLLGNKLVSGTHCFIERDSSGKVWLHDTSTNGTLVNLSNKLTGMRGVLEHGDEIHIVYRKADEELNVAYVYQDRARLREEEQNDTLDDSQQLDHTVDNSDMAAIREESDDTAKRKSAESSNVEPPLKWQRSEEKVSMTSNSRSDVTACIVGATTSSQVKAGTDDMKDAFEETLICIICQEILHDCISCQPCMHSFCAGCYSDWMERSEECPSCRAIVDRVSKNHIVKNLVEAYLKEHPEKQRPEEELKMLDARNKIPQNTFKPPKPQRTMSDIIDDDDDDYSNSDISDNDNEYIGHLPPPNTGTAVPGTAFTTITTPFGTPTFFGMYKPPKTVCRQCPEYKDPISAAVAAVGSVVSKVVGMVTGGGTSTPGGSTTGVATAVIAGTSTGGTAGTGPSGSVVADDVKMMPVAPVYQCTPTQTHTLCQCCLQPFPDRRMEANPTIGKSQCVLCYRFFCHQYWGCRKDDCMGCLAPFQEHTFGNKVLGGLLLENQYESDILMNYLGTQGMTLKAVLKDCCTRLVAGQYTCMDQARGLTPNTLVCYACGLRNFRDVAYQYRRDIPKARLPAAVTTRPDCYWGKNCRTQKGKLHHAAKFNHICEQTKVG